MINPYKVLGVPNGSDKSICKKTYRKLCAKYHPDNGGDTNKFNEINEAWKQIESGILEGVGVKQNKKSVVHNTMFSYKFA